MTPSSATPVASDEPCAFPAATTAHVAFVAVAPDHRRRGTLTRLVTRQLTQIAAAGEPLAVLWASEGRIYPRFVFGLAATRLVLDVDTREIRLPPIESTGGRVQLADPSDVASNLRAVYDRARVDRPG